MKQAFPTLEQGGNGLELTDTGMTLRDYFAAKAMLGLMGRVWGDLPPDELMAIWAKSSYAMADAMMAAREAK